MGSGKSTAARTLAPDALDSDVLVEAAAGAPVDKIFERDGEAAFRKLEERIALDALERAGRGEGGGVLSLGGGALQSTPLREALKAHTVVLLDSDVETVWRRVHRSRRPLAQDRQAFDQLHASREALYLDAADAIVPAVQRDSVQNALPAIRSLASLPKGTKMLWAESDSGSYPVWIGHDLAGRFPFPGGKRLAVISDTNVSALFGEAVPSPMVRLVMAAGEEHKTLDTCERLWGDLAAAGVSRDDAVVALGGGVVGDVGGFVAATYQRGIPVIQMPTTLVAQVDSAYGGKTGVDLPAAKNYVGAYHQPRAVMVDVATLTTLPKEEFAAGMAEVVKTALIAGGALWDKVAAGEQVDANTVLHCARTKLAVVREDERDGGRRQVLNLGHTIGHAIETVTNYKQFRHGEAVAIGLMASLRLSHQDDLRQQVGHLLSEAGLPLTAGNVDASAVLAAIDSDKKRRGDGSVPFVLCESPGSVSHGNVMEAAEVKSAIEEVCR
jgi:shikimate kinase/3-dehydroquinate synthase